MNELKFYCPLKIQQDTQDYDSYEYEEISSYDAAEYESEINQYIDNFTRPEEKERGLMHWYHRENSIAQKFHSAFMSVETREHELYGVVTAKIDGELSPNELEKFSDYCIGQLADGIGESLEQRPIKTPDGDIYVSFWNSSNYYFFKPEYEVFEQQDMGMEEEFEQDFNMDMSM